MISLHSNKYYLFIFVVIFALGILIYSPIRDASFQFDDRPTIINNPTIKNLTNIGWIWRWDPSRFLTIVSFALNYHWGNLDPFGYHLVNLVLHFEVTLLVFYFIFLTTTLWRQKGGEGVLLPRHYAGLGALLFLVHPVQTQAVSYVAQRATLLASFFYLSTLICYIEYRLRGRFALYAASLGFAFLGVFCKPIIITLPLAIILYDFCFLQDRLCRPDWQRIKCWIPYFAIVALVPILLVLWRHEVFRAGLLIQMTRETETISRYHYLLTQFNVLLTYIRLLVFPLGLNIDYDYPIAQTFWELPTGLSALVLLMLIGVGLKVFQRHRILAFSIFWFFVTLSIESSIFPISDVIFEHRLYLPIISYALLLPLVLTRIYQKKVKFVCVFLAIIAFYSILTFRRNIIWQDPIKLWSDAVAKSPEKARPHLNLSTAIMNAGYYPTALKVADKAIVLKPDYPDAYAQRGFLYSLLGDSQAALSDFDRALELKPDFFEVMNNRGYLLSGLQRYDEAMDDYNRALNFNPMFGVVYNNRGNVYLARGQYPLAMADYNRAIQIEPRYAKAYHNRGTVYRLQKEFEKAVVEYSAAIARDPTFALSYYHRSIVYAALQQFDPALEDYLQAKKLGHPVDQPYFRSLKRAIKKH